MVETTGQTVETVAEPVVVEPVVVPRGETAEQAVIRLEAEMAKSNELVSKLRRFEKENKAAADKASRERDTISAKYEAESAKRVELETVARTKAVDSAVEAALVAAKVKAPSTAAKLLDKSKIEFDGTKVDDKAIASMIAELQKSDPVLFEADDINSPKHPTVKKAVDGTPVGGYETEMRLAKNPRQIESIMRKYGLLSG